MTDLAPWVLPTLQLVAIVVAAIVAIIAVRVGAAATARQLLRRDERSDDGVLPSGDLERRVRTIQDLAVRAVTVAIVVIASLMVLHDLVGLDIGPAVAGLGVVAIAVGLGAQALVKDWLAGIFVILENQYSRGDVVQIAGVDGVVEDFSLRRTVLRDGNGTVHSVPTGLVGVASNLTRVWARVNLNVSVTYDTDIEAASRLIDRIGEEMQNDADWSDRLLETPTVVRIDSLGDHGITLKVMGQVRAAEQWAVAGELRKRILAGFRANDITIAFPHSVVVNPPASPMVAAQSPVATPPSPEPSEPSDEEAGS
jgi:small conductance mechanosensitive channel